MNDKYIIIPKHFGTNEVNEFRKNLINLINKGERNFKIDFNECTFIDVTGLGALISIHNKCKKVSGKLKLSSVNNANVMEVLRLTRLDKIFEISKTK